MVIVKLPRTFGTTCKVYNNLKNNSLKKIEKEKGREGKNFIRYLLS